MLSGNAASGRCARWKAAAAGPTVKPKTSSEPVTGTVAAVATATTTRSKRPAPRTGPARPQRADPQRAIHGEDDETPRGVDSDERRARGAREADLS